jgi:hypothetical protein
MPIALPASMCNARFSRDRQGARQRQGGAGSSEEPAAVDVEAVEHGLNAFGAMEC